MRLVEKKPKDDAMEGQDTGAQRKAPDAGAENETRLPKAHGQKVPVSVLDRRRVGKEGEGAQAAEPDTKPLYVQQLEERVKRAEEAYKQRVAELQEETRRSRERLLQDLDKRFQDKEKTMLLEVLGLLDDLERACSLTSSDPKVAQGLALIASRAGQFLKSHGCRTLSPIGEPFDPNMMEAVAMQEGPAGTVVGVLQPGYLQGDALLRAARVLVGKGLSGS
jgi:molecular chaperone GrpE